QTLHVDARRRTDEVLLGWALPVDALDRRHAGFRLLGAALQKLLDERLVRTEQVASSVGVRISIIGSSVILWLDVTVAEVIDVAHLLFVVERAVTTLRAAPLSNDTFWALRNGAEWDLLFELEAPIRCAHKLAL